MDKKTLLRDQAEVFIDMGTDAMTLSLEWRDLGADKGSKCSECGRYKYEEGSASTYRNRAASVQQKCMDTARKMLTEYYEGIGTAETPEQDAINHIDRYVQKSKQERRRE